MQTCLLYMEVIQNVTGRKYKRDTQRPGFLSEEKDEPHQRSVLKFAVFSFNIF